MTRRHASPASADALLLRARSARSAAGRAKYATRGLSQPRLARDTQFLLLRQLMIAHLQRGQHLAARAIAEQMTRIGTFVDVAHFDASNLALVCGDWNATLAHARLAARTAPASRRGLHGLRLGRRLSLVERHTEAARALARAQRWAPQLRAICDAEMALWKPAASDASIWAGAYAPLQRVADPGPAELWLAVRLLWRLQRRELVPQLVRSLEQRLRSLPPAARIGYWTEEQRVQRLLACPDGSASEGEWDAVFEDRETERRRSGY